MLEAIVTVAFVEIDDEGNAYTSSQVQRVEFEGDVDSFMEYVREYYRAVHAEQLGAVAGLRRPMTFNHEVVTHDELTKLINTAAADDKLLVQEGDTALIIDDDEATSATIYVVE